MPDRSLQAAVRAKLESAVIERDPFPHVVIPDLLPEPFFRELDDAIPPFTEFTEKGVRANLHLEKYLGRAPDHFRATWGRFRDEIVRGPLAEVLTRRFEDEIREKFATLYSAEIADEIMSGGLEIADGRIMLRKPGYTLKPHTDPAHFALTYLLYFTSADEDSSGALCLFQPERTPELLHTSTYYAENKEGIKAQLAKVVPISKNLFVAFVNGARALHGVRVERGEAATPRLAFQAHLVPIDDPRRVDAAWLARMSDPAARTRWEAWATEEAARE